MILCVERSVGHVGEIMIRGNGPSATSYHNLPPLELVKWSPLVYFCDEDAFVRLDFAENFHSVSTTFDIFT